jgi:PAS domain S-box-containing protein
LIVHKLLARQLRKRFGAVENCPTSLEGFVTLVDQAYHQADLDRGLLERSMDLVSEELMAANRDLRQEREELERRVDERTRALSRANEALENEILERERINLAVKLSEEKYRTLFEESLDAICVTTVDGTLLDLNRAAVKGLGFSSREEALDVNVMSLYVDLEDRRRLFEELERCGFVAGRELELETLDNRRLIVLASSVGLRDARGEITTVRTTLRDVTDRRALQNQLLQAQKIEAVGRLAGGVAHEFNNLLTTISGCAELLSLAADPGSEAQSLIEEIRAASRRGTELTQRLLAFGRRQPLVERELDLNHVVNNVRSLLHRLLGEDVDIVTSLEAQRPEILGDFAQLEQMIINLAINARDAMPAGGRLEFATADVTVGEGSRDPGPAALGPGRYVLFSVSDTGSGIADDIRQYIFEPFFTTREDDSRTGLGLATVHGVVQQAGGHVEVESAVGEGTTFRIYWPAAAEEEAMTAIGARGAQERQVVVLVVDDDDGVRSLTSRVLKKHGFIALEASGGAEALEIYSQQEGKVAVLVSDIVMPGMQGPELAQRLRSQAPELKVLLMSGYSESLDSLQRKPSEQSTGFLQKPFSPGDLVAQVERLLRAS